MRIYTSHDRSGKRLSSPRLVGSEKGETAKEAIEEFKKRTGWDEKKQGKLFIPLYESDPGI